jgi:site-specific recombinase XerD
MGHKDIKTTQIYAKIIDEKKRPYPQYFPTFIYYLLEFRFI